MKLDYHFIVITLLFSILAFFVLTRKEPFTQNEVVPKLSIFPGNKKVIANIQLTEVSNKDYIILQYFTPYQSQGKVSSKVIPVQENTLNYNVPITGLFNEKVYQFQCWLVKVNNKMKYTTHPSNIVMSESKTNLKIFS